MESYDKRSIKKRPGLLEFTNFIKFYKFNYLYEYNLNTPAYIMLS